MRTSATQFEMMVTFMEQHGDITKPRNTAMGKIKTIKDWEDLTAILNSDASGEQKNTEKWKKVWSDLKNNCKKKAAKINRAARCTGGGSALHLKLTDLEQRVLNIIGHQAATGLVGVVEAGFSQAENDPERTATFSPTPDIERISSPRILISTVAEDIHFDYEALATPGPSRDIVPQPASPPRHQPSPSSPPPPPPPIIEFINTIEGHTTPPATTPIPALQGHTPQRRTGRRGLTRRTATRRRVVKPQSHVEQVAQHFRHSDEEWRTFLQRKHDDEVNLEKERLRIRELELQVQQSWQEITRKALESLNTIVDSLIKKH